MPRRCRKLSVVVLGVFGWCCVACNGGESPHERDRAQSGDAGPTSGSDAAGIVQLDAAGPSDGGGTAFADGGVSDAGFMHGDATTPLDAGGGADAASDAAVDANLTPDAGPGDAQAPGQPAEVSPKQLVLGKAHGCSLDPAISGVICWGDNRRGQATVPPLNNPRFVAAGGDVSCAIDGAGSVKCWGDNAHGQLDVPAGLGATTQVAVGGSHVCALGTGAGVRCWGDDTTGQLTAPAVSGVRAIGAGAQHTCALAGDGVHCWGDNAQGQLDAPVLRGVTQLAAGAFHNCALGAEGITCWGGVIAALRNGAPAVSAPRAIAAGGSHNCVIDGGAVRCWGDPTTRSLAPRELTLPRQVAVGGGGELAFACARHQQGISCWGDNSLGQTEYNGSPLHLLYRAEAEIDAPPALVWDVLMDLEDYAAWNPYTTAMQSTLKVGDPMIMTVRMSELLTITQTEHIRVLEPGHKVCWGIETTTPELNSGERCQWLEPLPGGGTRYVTEDLIEGVLNAIVLGVFDNDLQIGFEGVARGLKARAEALANE